MGALKNRGGIAIVQDPSEAPFPSMPMSVIRSTKVDYSLSLREIAPLLIKLSRETPEQEGRYPVPRQLEIESKIAEQEMGSDEMIASVEKLGKISRLTCPDCSGALWEIADDEMLRFRCHVGHAFSDESLIEGQSQMLDGALWSAVRALEEQMLLAKRIVERARKANHRRAVTIFERRAEEAERQSSLIRQVLLNSKKGDIGGPAFNPADD
jgi:two-component system chemotaxis response regulator CheB